MEMGPLCCSFCIPCSKHCFHSHFILVCTYVCTCYYPHPLLPALAVPHAVPAPDSAGLLPGVVAFSVALFAVLLLLLAAVVSNAILFSTRESVH